MQEYKWLMKWVATRPEVRGTATVQYYAQSAGDPEVTKEDDDEELVSCGKRADSVGTLQLQTASGGDTMSLRTRPVPGGSIILRVGGRLVWLRRDASPPSTPSSTRSSSGRGAPPPVKPLQMLHLTLRRSGSLDVMQTLLSEARTSFLAHKRGTLTMYEPARVRAAPTRGGGGDPRQQPSSGDDLRWMPLRGARSVPLRKVVLPPDAGVQALLADVVRFLSSEQWYMERGIPYHRGYLLWGPAGCGKTMLIQALATELELGLYCVDLAQPGLTDENLASLFRDVPSRSLIAVDHIDRAFDGRERRVVAASSGSGGGAAAGITFSGLLNVLDGVNASNGCVVFFTAEAAADTMDEALMRPGRCDYECELHGATPETGAQLYRNFFARHPFHELSTEQLDAATAEFRAALAARDAQQPFSMRDVVSFITTRSPRRAIDEAQLLGLDAIQTAAASGA